MTSLPWSWARLAILLSLLLLVLTLSMMHLNSNMREEVGKIKGSLLGCAKKEIDTEQKCLYEYNLTLSFTPTMGRTVMLDPDNVKLVCSLLSPDMKVLEYGSGGSTTFFSQFVKSWDSMEHDANWMPKVVNVLKQVPWANKVTVHLVPRDIAHSETFEGTPEEYRSYIDKPASLGQQFDLIIDDGRARVGVGQGVVTNRLLAPGGRMLIHDWERLDYKKLVTQVGFKVDRQDKLSKRHMALLKLE